MSKRSFLEKNFNIKELDWAETRKLLLDHDKTLVTIIDNINPPKDFTFFITTYRYGDEILKQGKLSLPKKSGELVSLYSDSVPSYIQEQLGYNLGSNPAGIILNGTLEQFIDLGSRIISYDLIYPNRLFGLWRILDPQKSFHPMSTWSLTAGARSIFMLTKISNQAKHNKIKRQINISADVPISYKDHWTAFKEIANSSYMDTKWQLQYLFFSKQWFDHLNDNSWQIFKNYLLEKVWRASSFWRNKNIWDITYTRILGLKSVKIDPYILDNVKHLFSLCTGTLPAFVPATDDASAPISKLQQLYENIYGLDNKAPIIMQPAYFKMYEKKPSPVYYSLQFPTAMELSPKTNEKTSTVADLFKMKSLYEKYQDVIISGKLNLDMTPLQDISKKIQVDFFHNTVEGYHGIKESNTILSKDAILRQLVAKYNNKILHDNCSFFRGSILIRKK